MDEQSNAMRSRSAFARQRDRSQSLDMNVGQEQWPHPLRMYTACGLLGAWSRLQYESEEGEEEEENRSQDSRATMLWSSPGRRDHKGIATTTAGDSRAAGDGVASKNIIFEDRQKASGEKVLSRLRERQQSLEDEQQQHQHPSVGLRASSHPPEEPDFHTPTRTRSLPRKLMPLWRHTPTP